MTLIEHLRDSRLVSVSQRLGIERSLHDIYWAVFPLFIDEHYQDSVGEATAEFHLSTPAERHNLRDSDFLGERSILRDLLDRVRPDDVFHDIGAQFGAYSCFVADVLDEDDIVAFDPDPHRVKRIETNFELNGIDGTVLPYALSDERGEQNFKLSTGELTEGRGTAVQTTTVDYLVNGGMIPEPSIVKVDVEGAELDVFRGMTETLNRNPPRHVYCETHDSADIDSLRDILRSHGYTIEELSSHSTFLHATTERTKGSKR